MERLAAKAKEKALEASQKMQSVKLDAAANEAEQNKALAEEKRKMAAEMQASHWLCPCDFQFAAKDKN